MYLLFGRVDDGQLVLRLLQLVLLLLYLGFVLLQFVDGGHQSRHVHVLRMLLNLCGHTALSDSDDGDQQDGAQRSQADHGEAVRPNAAQPGAQTVGGNWASWKRHTEEKSCKVSQ
ncbi:hypothetical protein INR49_014711 [Caranx melampygus]|nr:hypothetical protein INR49_014711 [Caranx melampygus]